MKRALEINTGRRVAVKTVELTRENVVKSVINELQILREGHKDILSLIDAYIHDKRVFMVTELMDFSLYDAIVTSASRKILSHW